MTHDPHLSPASDAQASMLSPAASPTAHLLDELQLYGCRPNGEEPDPRPLPEAEQAEIAIAGAVDALCDLLADTRLEDECESLLWSFVNIFHRRIDAFERALDANEQAQRRAQRAQDGSEVKSVALERLIAQGIGLIERRNAFEAFRDIAAARFGARTASAWRPHAGSMISRRTLTAAMIDSRDFLAARRRAEQEVMLPAGTRIAFAGGIACADHARIWAVLDKARARHPGMVLLHGGAPKGAERIAACWAEARGVTQIVFKPDWARHGKAAPFRRNDGMLEAAPIGLIAFSGSGITDNLVDKARRMGIPVRRFGGGA